MICGLIYSINSYDGKKIIRAVSMQVRCVKKRSELGIDAIPNTR